jgi:hypothetical protein
MRSSSASILLRSWPALLLAPLLMLGLLSLAYALVTPACAHQGGEGLHALAGTTLLLALALTGLAWDGWRAAGALPRSMNTMPADHEGGSDLFLSRVATLVGAFSSLTIVALWIPLWLLSPCL